jgi:hypothetical protein
MKIFYVYDNISLSYSYNQKCSKLRCRENWKTNFLLINIFPKIVPFER